MAVRKRWVVVRPPGAETGILLARADGERQATVVGNQVAGDAAGMRELTDEAAAIAARLTTGPLLLRDHGGGFTPVTVQLHRISAEYVTGDLGAALAAARKIRPAGLPTIERRAHYYTDLARAHHLAGGREQCPAALLAAERQAPQETHARPAVRDLVQSLLISSRTSPAAAWSCRTLRHHLTGLHRAEVLASGGPPTSIIPPHQRSRWDHAARAGGRPVPGG
ncbi:hypothetical protein Ssi03_04210 [Sphaerisporangium siamense]|uniref:Uncharacterized protein n=1 Tax=Sphaerisporangium siamense TaxID=795645 RepID=A0A7W7GCY0_9ACTN|nr:hypothetical protein [Sphaerisporangium siamense]MBB4703959.1 hypothetical protein [Sphaerisporangium siamense]GII82431.1 hypothetical protein Ssi03_04210 [Sphaerisporangium siamense]